MNYDLNFGIIPIPKYNAEQESYHQYTTGHCTTVICFPTTTKDDDLDFASFMVEAMAIESVESAAMIDIITTSVSSDAVKRARENTPACHLYFARDIYNYKQRSLQKYKKNRKEIIYYDTRN